MTCIHDFVVDLAMAKKSPKEIVQLMHAAYGQASLSDRQVYQLVKAVKGGQDPTDRRGKGSYRKKKIPEMIEAVKALVKDDARIALRSITAILDLHHPTIISILHDDLGLSEKSARWVQKGLT